MLLDRTNRGPALDLVVELDRRAGAALHRQIEAAIRTAIHAGRLRKGCTTRSQPTSTARAARRRGRRTSSSATATRRASRSSSGCWRVRAPRPAGVAARLHLVAYLPTGVAEADVIAGAAERGVAVHGVGPYRLAPEGAGALLFGYGTLDEARIELGVRLVADAVRAVA